MLQLTLCGSLCETFSFSKFKTKAAAKTKTNIESFVQAVTDIVAMQDEKFKVYDHILYKLIQYSGSEFGCIAKPVVSDRIILSRYAASSIMSSDFLNYCSHAKHIVDDVFRNKKVYIQNKCSILHLPYIKRIMIVPIIIQEQVICVIIMANKLQPFVKADASTLTSLIKTVLYIFTSDCLFYDKT